MNTKKALWWGLSILVIVVLLSSLWIYRKNVVEWGITRYFNHKGIEVRFNISSLDLSEFSLTDIVVDNKINIESVRVGFGSGLPMTNLNGLNLSVNELDLVAMLDVLRKISEPSGKSSDLQFNDLYSMCSFSDQMALDIKINKLLVKGKKTPLDFTISKSMDVSKTHVEFKGKLLESPTESLKIKKLSIESEISVDCKPEKIALVIKKWDSILKDFVHKDSKLNIKSAQTNLRDTKIEVLPSDDIRFQISSQLDLDLKKSATPVVQGALNSTIKGLISLKDYNSMDVELKAHEMFMFHPYRVKMSSAKLKLKRKSLGEPISGSYVLKDVEQVDADGDVLFKNILITGKFETKETSYRLGFNLSDKIKILNLKNGELLYDTKLNTMSISVPENPGVLILNDKILEVFPVLGKDPVKAGGKLLIYGDIAQSGELAKGKIRLRGRNLQFKTEQMEIENLNIRHDIINYSSLASGPDQIITADKIKYGPVITDLKLQYQVFDPSRIKVKSLDGKIDGVGIHAVNFLVNSEKKTMKGFEAKVTHLPIEKLLKGALGESVKAVGVLNGHFKVNYEGDIPLFKGHLKSENPGWVRYRKPEGEPIDFKKLSANPISILSAYLHDFKYEKFDIVFESDFKYELKMTLRTLGSNPQYLSGKPLKLNVNVDQNLLSAFRAMVLTYDLPNSIKKKIEKMGAK